MSIPFSDTTNNLGIYQQALSLARVDSEQWPIWKVVNSANNWHDFVVGYALGSDRNVQWDDTNHTKLPEGTVDLTINQSDYSFTTDEQGNAIVTLTGVSVFVDGKEVPLKAVDRNDANYDIGTFGKVSGTPSAYDKIADNIIRLDTLPPATVSNGLKFYFQRVGSYFAATDTTKTPGVSPVLHRGYVIAAAYDISLTLGTENLNALSIERQREEKNVQEYFSIRGNDNDNIMRGKKILFI